MAEEEGGEERRGGRCHHLLLSFLFSSSERTFVFSGSFFAAPISSGTGTAAETCAATINDNLPASF